MATASPAESGGARVMTAMTHALPWVLGVAVVLRVVSWFGLLTWLNLAAAAVLCTFTVATMLHRRSSHLCVRCMDEVPADAPVRAERQKRTLWFCHAAASPAGLCSIAAIIAAPVLVMLIGDPPLVRLARIPLDVWVFAVAYSVWRHHQLRPWCPYCRDWDDDGEPEPSPDPTRFGTRSGR